MNPLLLLAAESASQAATQAAHATGGPSVPIVFLFVLLLSTFLGLEVIRRVSPLLHTPLMSLTNAISAIAVVGAIVVAGSKSHYSNTSVWLGGIAVFASMTNIVSGFLITDRMLKMFKTREPGK